MVLQLKLKLRSSVALSMENVTEATFPDVTITAGFLMAEALYIIDAILLGPSQTCLKNVAKSCMLRNY